MGRGKDKEKRDESYTRARDKSRDQGRSNRVAGTESLRFLTDHCSLSEDTGDRTRAERHAASPVACRPARQLTSATWGSSPTWQLA